MGGGSHSLVFASQRVNLLAADGAYRYSVFVTKTGKRAVVVINQEREKNITL